MSVVVFLVNWPSNSVPRETSPSQFALKVYSNALMLPTDAEPKPKASNTLLSTQLDYVDEMLDWDFSITPQVC